jgi:TadE-like protein
MTSHCNPLYRRKERGQSIVELALLTPLILAALYVPVDFGMAFFTAHLTQNAVREGARIGSGLMSSDPTHPIQSNEGTTVKNAVFARLPRLLSTPSVNVKFYFSGSAANCMQVMEITTTGSYNYAWYRFLELIGFDTPTALTISKRTQMRYSYQPPSNTSTICGNTGFNQSYSS